MYDTSMVFGLFQGKASSAKIYIGCVYISALALVRSAARTDYFLRDGQPGAGGLPGLAGQGLTSHSLSYHLRSGSGMAARLNGRSKFPDKLIVMKQVQDQAKNIISKSRSRSGLKTAARVSHLQASLQR